MGLFADQVAENAENDLTKYGDLLEGDSPLKERIGEYWAFVGRPDLDGGDHDVPWSAAFISFMVHLAGAGSAFPYNAQHSVYFYRTINDKLIKKKTSFWGYRPEELTIERGDILGMNRSNAPAIDYDWASHHSDFKSHSDIVVKVDNKGIHTIGGNVGKAPGQVGAKTFVKQGGIWKNKAGKSQQAFVVIRSFLP
ncbi:DUF2272 domain-containing protein [Bradyrhizobium sp.]|uniref:DUF2272 domain-containing protein n=1 Tax=Bradyrhizobium sp. TaxID=376 RepID=UPI002DFB9C20|nr:DUF2272 domain-containing protein [Bradyrhizobium sp.]